MTVYAYSLTSVRLEFPMCTLLEGYSQQAIVEITSFPGVTLRPITISQRSGIFEKFRREQDYGMLAPHLERTHCELVIDESEWIEYFGDEYTKLNAEEKMANIDNVAHSFLTLLRFRGCSHFIVPIAIRGSSFGELKTAPDHSVDAQFYPAQNLIQPSLPPVKPRLLSMDDVEWACKFHHSFAEMMYKSNITFVIDVFNAIYHPNPTVQLIMIWATIEAITKPTEHEENKSGIRHSIRSRAAAILCDSAEEMKKKYDDIGVLYDLRSSASHGKDKFSSVELQKENFDDLVGSFSLLKDLLIRIVENNHLPNFEELEELQSRYEKMCPFKEE